jgi:hypothetical protein
LDSTRSRQAADRPLDIAGSKDRAGQAWRHHGSVFLVVGARYRGETATIHSVVWLDLPDDSPSDLTGKLSEKYELDFNPWEQERYMERVS